MHIYNTKRKISVLKSKSGFAVLFAVLLASFLITLGISIFSISLKEIQIVTSSRDSQIAYYAADSARECALYWDIKQGAFPACIDSTCDFYYNPNGDKITAINPISAQITCNGIPVTLTFNKSSPTGPTYDATYSDFFKASSTALSTPISDIEITKTYNGVVLTIIKALGHNTNILGRRVERGIQTNN